MTDFYKIKVDSFRNIDRIIKKDNPKRDDLAFDIERGTGYSKQSINTYIDSLIQYGYVLERDGVLVWNKQDAIEERNASP